MPQALQFMSVKQRLYYSVYIFIYKILNNMLPVSLRNKIEIAGSESQKRTRQAGNMLGLRKTRNAQKGKFFTKEFKKIYLEYNTIFLVIIDSIIN